MYNVKCKSEYSMLTLIPTDLKVLIEQGAYIEPRNFQNDTPLYLAANQGYTEIVQYLIDSGNPHERALAS